MKTITSSVAFQGPSGTVAAKGYLLLSLSQNAKIISGGGQVYSNLPIIIQLDANGLIPAGTQIFANDELTPTTTYLVDLQDVNRSRLDTLGAWYISGASPIDVSQQTPTAAGVSFAGVVFTNPSAQQNIVGQTLNLQGAALGFSTIGSTTPGVFLNEQAAGILGVGLTTTTADATIEVGNGLVGAPGYSFGSDPTTGIYRAGSADVRIANAGIDGFRVDSTSPTVPSGRPLAWGSAGTTSRDTGISRTGAAAIAFGNGAQADASATVSMATIAQPVSTTFALLDNNSGTRLLVPSNGTGQGTLNNWNLAGAANSNKVTLLNTQGPISAIVGTGADATVYTFTIPANTIGPGKGFRVQVVGFHNTGTASVGYKLTIGSTNLISVSATDGNTQNWNFSVFNQPGVQNSQYYEGVTEDGLAIIVNTFGTAAENFANAITVKFTFNVAATDQYTGKVFVVELIQ